jgi:hypothetical protein
MWFRIHRQMADRLVIAHRYNINKGRCSKLNLLYIVDRAKQASRKVDKLEHLGRAKTRKAIRRAKQVHQIAHPDIILIIIIMIPHNIVATAVTWKTMKSYRDVTSTTKNSLGGNMMISSSGNAFFRDRKEGPGFTS